MSPVVTSLPFQIGGPPSMPSPAGPISHHRALNPGPLSASAQHSRAFRPARFSDQTLNQGFRSLGAGGRPPAPFSAAQPQTPSTEPLSSDPTAARSSSPASAPMAPAAASRGALAAPQSPAGDSSDLKRTALPFRSGGGAPSSGNATPAPSAAAAAAAAANVAARSGTCASRHMAAEQRRRARINERLEALREIVPHSARANTAAFLTEVYDYVASLQAELRRRSEHAPDAGAEEGGKGKSPKKSAAKSSAKEPLVNTKGPPSREDSPEGASDLEGGEATHTAAKGAPGLDLNLGSGGAGREEFSEQEPRSGSHLRRRAPGSTQGRGAFTVYVAASKGGQEDGAGAKAGRHGSPARSPKQEGSGDDSEDGGDNSDDGRNHHHKLVDGHGAGTPSAGQAESPRRQSSQQHQLSFPLCGYPGPTAPHLAFAGAPMHLSDAHLGKAALALTLGPSATGPGASSAPQGSPSSAAGAGISLPGGALGTAFLPPQAAGQHSLMMPLGHPGGVPAPPRVPGPAQQSSRKRKDTPSSNVHILQQQQQQHMQQQQQQHMPPAGTLPFMMPPPAASASGAAAGSSNGTAGPAGSGAPGAGSMGVMMPMLPQMHPVAMAAAAAAAADAAAAAAVQQWNMAAAVAQAQAQAAVQAHAQAQALVSAVAASSAAAASAVAGSNGPSLPGPLPLPQPNGLATSSASRPPLMPPHAGAPAGHGPPGSALTPPMGAAPALPPAFPAPPAPPVSGAASGTAGAPAPKRRKRGAQENKDSTGQGAQLQRVVRPIAVRPRP